MCMCFDREGKQETLCVGHSPREFWECSNSAAAVRANYNLTKSKFLVTLKVEKNYVLKLMIPSGQAETIDVA